MPDLSVKFRDYSLIGCQKIGLRKKPSSLTLAWSLGHCACAVSRDLRVWGPKRPRPDIYNRGFPKFKSRSRDLGHAHFLAQFFIFCLVFPTLDPPAKFDVCSYILTGDNRGSQNSKLGHVT